MPAAPVISIVDDDAQARDGIRELIEALGYQTVTFKSAQDFLRSGIVANTSCLITDVQMPGMNGVDLQRHLLATGYRTPVIFVTAHPEAGLRKRALAAGALGFLSKPFREENLIACLDRATGTHNSRSQ